MNFLMPLPRGIHGINKRILPADTAKKYQFVPLLKNIHGTSYFRIQRKHVFQKVGIVYRHPEINGPDSLPEENIVQLICAQTFGKIPVLEERRASQSASEARQPAERAQDSRREGEPEPHSPSAGHSRT